MLHCTRKSTALAGVAIVVAATIAHRLLAQTPTLDDSVSGIFREIVTITSVNAGIQADDPQSTLYTVPSKRTLVVNTIVIANDQDNYTDVLVKENSTRKIALVRVETNNSLCLTFPAGLEWPADTKVNVENLGGPGGTLGGDVHITLNGYLKKPGTSTP